MCQSQLLFSRGCLASGSANSSFQICPTTSAGRSAVRTLVVARQSPGIAHATPRRRFGLVETRDDFAGSAPAPHPPKLMLDIAFAQACVGKERSEAVGRNRAGHARRSI